MPTYLQDVVWVRGRTSGLLFFFDDLKNSSESTKDMFTVIPWTNPADGRSYWSYDMTVHGFILLCKLFNKRGDDYRREVFRREFNRLIEDHLVDTLKPPKAATSSTDLTVPASSTDLTVPAVVTVKDNVVVANSRDVAAFFGKRHDHVLRDIGNLTKATPPDLGWFLDAPYRDAKGEYRPSWDMTRDGFTLLVMGYTGQDAMRFKVAYIQAFNRMEEALKAKTPHPITPVLPDFSDPAAAARAWAEQYEQRKLVEALESYSRAA